MAKRRVMKKHYRIVRDHLNKKKVVPWFYLNRVRDYFSDFIDYRYLTVFRPWWYDQFDNWSELDFTNEHRKHFAESEKKFAENSKIDLRLLREEIKRQKRPSKDRVWKEKERVPEPIRKLRRPQEYFIRNFDGSKQAVMGEKAFQVNGHEFFIFHNGRQWCVTDTAVGAAVSWSHRYKKAVQTAKERIENNFDHYLKLVEKHQTAADMNPAIKCYVCRERDAVAQFLDQGICRECGIGIQIS